MWERLRAWAKTIKRDIVALYLATRDPRTPWYAKAVAVGVVAYALSPIDLIPDFISVLGYLDDLILVPLGILLVVRLIPPELMAEFRHRAANEEARLPIRWIGAAIIISLWLSIAVAVAWWVWRR